MLTITPVNESKNNGQKTMENGQGNGMCLLRNYYAYPEMDTFASVQFVKSRERPHDRRMLYIFYFM